MEIRNGGYGFFHGSFRFKVLLNIWASFKEGVSIMGMVTPSSLRMTDSSNNVHVCESGNVRT
jgi:hypothetical protein